MKAFVDTNILIDYVGKREPFFIPAKSVFAMCSPCLFCLYIMLRILLLCYAVKFDEGFE